MNKKRLTILGTAGLVYSIISFVGFGISFLPTETIPNWITTIMGIVILVSGIVTIVYLVKIGKNKKEYGEYQNLISKIRITMIISLAITYTFLLCSLIYAMYAFIFLFMLKGFAADIDPIMNKLEIARYVILVFWLIIFITSIVCIHTSGKLDANSNNIKEVKSEVKDDNDIKVAKQDKSDNLLDEEW